MFGRHFFQDVVKPEDLCLQVEFCWQIEHFLFAFLSELGPICIPLPSGAGDRGRMDVHLSMQGGGDWVVVRSADVFSDTPFVSAAPEATA